MDKTASNCKRLSNLRPQQQSNSELSCSKSIGHGYVCTYCVQQDRAILVLACMSFEPLSFIKKQWLEAPVEFELWRRTLRGHDRQTLLNRSATISTPSALFGFNSGKKSTFSAWSGRNRRCQNLKSVKTNARKCCKISKRRKLSFKRKSNVLTERRKVRFPFEQLHFLADRNTPTGVFVARCCSPANVVTGDALCEKESRASTRWLRPVEKP